MLDEPRGAPAPAGLEVGELSEPVGGEIVDHQAALHAIALHLFEDAVDGLARRFGRDRTGLLHPGGRALHLLGVASRHGRRVTLAEHQPEALLEPLDAFPVGVRLIFLDLGEIVHAGLLDGMAECLPADFVRFPAVSEASWAFHGGIPCLYCACRLRAGYGDKRPMK
ncbi:hypothetical protein SI859A1_01230 [Aurantimonas manganoxydans SI85-9A1]|uniref:Uncharacterized protein n=1 Tax=Aurantimonas manganoxydans (strain ATCC BAA-1229 / DSM 21871 / SI85-9A1) TaxID=287752 RepID=Q1YJ89_AURMS|nr:hypothetical protein SI859A1_01230 [Aurantimonas manganoxydans SI85-9A1]